jgi:ubiquinone/menaquinone biosynthesis C-methylase UbiE
MNDFKKNEINLLKSLPQAKRNISKRKEEKKQSVILEAKKFDYNYWDGPREYGYGGYNYDGRWVSVAKNIISFFDLKDNAKILDIGSGKGFLLNDLKLLNKSFQIFGLDISQYAINNSINDLKKYTIKHDAKDKLPYESNFFDIVLSINTIHNLKKNEVINCLKEINRVVKDEKNCYIVLDSYLNEKQKEIFESWVLTAEFYGYPHEWFEVFEKAGYRGYYSWTIIN